MLRSMNRLDGIFQARRETGGKALMPFLTAGDPDLATTAALLPALERAGASVVELGIPFSDPIADGPVIEQSMGRALEAGVTVTQTFQTVRALRRELTLGLVAMVSYSIVHRRGLDAFVDEAAASGIDGLIFPDLPLEEAGPARRAADRAGLSLSMLIAPSTPIDRAREIARASTGFVYVVSRSGTTGEQVSLPAELPERLRELRSVTELPIAVGFGIARPEHVREVVSVADAAIVGSALMRQVAEHCAEGRDALIGRVERFVTDLASGLEPAPSGQR